MYIFRIYTMKYVCNVDLYINDIGCTTDRHASNPSCVYCIVSSHDTLRCERRFQNCEDV